MSEQPPHQWGQNPYEQPQDNHPTQPYGQPQWGQQPQQGQPQWGQPQWGQQPWGQPAPQDAYGQQWGPGPGGPVGPGGPGGPGQPGGSRKTLWIVLAAVVVLVLAGVTTAVLVFTNNDDDTNSADDDTSSSASASASPSDEESAEESASSAETSPAPVTSAPVGGDAVFTFPQEVDGRTLDPSSAPEGGVVGPDDSFIMATYKGSEITDMMIYQYMKDLDAKSYAEATDHPVTEVGDAYCSKVLDGMESYACAVDYAEGVLFTSSNMTTVTSPQEVAAALQEMVDAIG
ncbi:hypothetical protein ncot_01180 [Nocardioides sp. JQ2195]|uniref:hypothetical protein n=1 Tax=Nocardioides sp. JQ2195 TaxID=2592334 RepID=UPI00143ED753|nr:hypothetical protein [Nocardioides sp. JQ2195]QIX25352.1 hypothetical protein ncot_01180 [Nocardioides sp. JQ2195]